MVSKRGWSLQKFVDLTTTNAAKLMGLYPRKGAIVPGADADITILYDSKRRKVRAVDLHETDYKPWEGHEVTAWPVVTILRGDVVVEGGNFYGNPASGRYLKRYIPESVRARRSTLAAQSAYSSQYEQG